MLMTPAMQLFPAITFALGMTVAVSLPSPYIQRPDTAPVGLSGMTRSFHVVEDNREPLIHGSELGLQVADLESCAHLVKISDSEAVECDTIAEAVTQLPRVLDPTLEMGPFLLPEEYSREDVASILADYCRARWADAVADNRLFDTESCVFINSSLDT